MRRMSAAKLITLGAMCTALTVLSLYAASVLPGGKLASYFLSSVFVYALLSEQAYAAALLSFAASTWIAIFILPDRLYIAPFITLIGHYGIFRTWLEPRLDDKVVRFIIRMLYCNICTAGGICTAVFIFSYDIASYVGALPFAAWIIIPVLEAGFVLFDVLYWMCKKIYDERIKHYLSARR